MPNRRDTHIRGVLFDLGGVVLGSPLLAIEDYERERGCPPGSFNRLVAASPDDGPWQRLERGDVDLDAFYPLLGAMCDAADLPLDPVELMRRVRGATAPRARVLHAVDQLKARGLVTAALTNNWPGDSTGPVAERFSPFIESCKLGMRKPDPRIYPIAAEQMGLAAREILFMDDIGYNLKPAKALGMHTVKIRCEQDVLDALAPLLEAPPTRA